MFKKFKIILIFQNIVYNIKKSIYAIMLVIENYKNFFLFHFFFFLIFIIYDNKTQHILQGLNNLGLD